MPVTVPAKIPSTPSALDQPYLQPDRFRAASDMRGTLQDLPDL
jgi:hypothetical protein